jgi:pimeloyl-ACP methyl ester carboxylesterase
MTESLASRRTDVDPGAQAATGRLPGAAPSLEPALSGQRHYTTHHGQQIAMYVSMPRRNESNAHLTPLLLVHSINAAASAAEVRPVFDRYASERPVVALELPGFGSSNRRHIDYTPRLMSDCICRAAEYLVELGFRRPADLMAVSLSCEMAARAALKRPAAFRSLAFVSPTGFESRRPERYENGRAKDKPWLRWLLESGPWANALFTLLTSEKSMRKFLERTWGSRHIDEALLAYNLLTVKQPGARHAPYAFVGGALFTRGVAHLYAQLKQPVWMIHGCKGEFAKVPGLEGFSPSRSWSIESIDAGAMPYFEQPEEFGRRYDRFLAQLQRA